MGEDWFTIKRYNLYIFTRFVYNWSFSILDNSVCYFVISCLTFIPTYDFELTQESIWWSLLRFAVYSRSTCFRLLLRLERVNTWKEKRGKDLFDTIPLTRWFSGGVNKNTTNSVFFLGGRSMDISLNQYCMILWTQNKCR